MGKINVVGVALVLLGFILVMYGAGKVMGLFTIVPSFLVGSTPSINSTGVYATSGSWDTGWQSTFAIYGFKQTGATTGGQSVQLVVPTRALGNGVYGLFKCAATAPEPNVYYVVTGTGMSAPDSWKIFNLNNPTSMVTVDYGYIAKEEVSLDGLNNDVYSICGGGTNNNGQPTSPFSGTAVHLSRDFSSAPATCNNNGVCDSGETTTNCPSDCVSVTPSPATGNYGVMLLGILLIGGGLWMVR